MLDFLYETGQTFAAADVQAGPLRAVWWRGQRIHYVEDLVLRIVRSHEHATGLVGQLLKALARHLFKQSSVRYHGPLGALLGDRHGGCDPDMLDVEILTIRPPDSDLGIVRAKRRAESPGTDGCVQGHEVLRDGGAEILTGPSIPHSVRGAAQVISGAWGR